MKKVLDKVGPMDNNDVKRCLIANMDVANSSRSPIVRDVRMHSEGCI